jgi:hypothetical protein
MAIGIPLLYMLLAIVGALPHPADIPVGAPEPPPPVAPPVPAPPVPIRPPAELPPVLVALPPVPPVPLELPPLPATLPPVPLLPPDPVAPPEPVVPVPVPDEPHPSNENKAAVEHTSKGEISRRHIMGDLRFGFDRGSGIRSGARRSAITVLGLDAV